MSVLAGKTAWLVVLAVLGVGLALGLGSSIDAADAARQRGTIAFVHTSTNENTYLDCTTIDKPAINGRPNAKLVVTHRIISGTGHDKTLGIDYDTSSQKWVICNEDISDMPIGLSFNVMAVR